MNDFKEMLIKRFGISQDQFERDNPELSRFEQFKESIKRKLSGASPDQLNEELNSS